jgi:hypothetical protein
VESSSEARQEAQVVLKEGTEVRDTVSQHGDALNAEAEGETLVSLGINAAIL